MKRPYEVHESETFTLRAAEILSWVTRQAVEARGVAHIAISGGSTPKPLFKLLTTEAWQARIPWAQTHIWWVDERCVPPDNPNSNFGVAYALLLRYLPVVISHRIRCEQSPDEALWLYEKEIETTFQLDQESWPHFDLILLGMGADGHTASLFPHTPALSVRDRMVTIGQAPASPRERISLSMTVLNQAAHVIFLVAGKEKGAALTQILHDKRRKSRLPAGLVQPVDGYLLWLLDTEAARAANLPFLP